ncbi:POX (plant homeobox) family protein [Tasmannia lanceolata]|uniref:POX (plant homeobox) family protein n=1 Tax=Tasmannia lanceolata TaxID=3420 RepID=UPI0040634E5A
MSEGFELEPYHVPQQSRRDKLRIFTHNEETTTSLMPFYDPTLNMLTCATGDNNTHVFHHQNPTSIPSFVKEESSNLMGFLGGGVGFFSSSCSSSSSSSCSSSSSSYSSHLFLDPSSTNPSSSNHEDITLINPLLYASQVTQNLRNLDQTWNNSGVTFKPQPLSFTQNSISLGQQGQAQGLSLSLSYDYQNQHLFSDKGFGGYFVPGIAGSSVPVGPFTGYTAVLKGSRFLKPTLQLLEEFCDVGRGVYVERNGAGEILPLDHEMDSLSGAGICEDPAGFGAGGDHGEHRRKNSSLISMLDEVYRRYKQYRQQMQNVIASFEAVDGLSAAAPYTYLALRAMLKHFRCLKNAITDQLRSTSKPLQDEVFNKEKTMMPELIDHGLSHQMPTHSSAILEPPHIWRPQRGLPEHAVSVLRGWLFDHFLHPYPTDTDKQMLAKQTGLSRNQVSNWFINARVRLWKPMVEEIHTLEMKQAEKSSEGEERTANSHGELRMDPTLPPVKQLQNNSSHDIQDSCSKRSKNDLTRLPDSSNESMSFSYDNVAGRHPVGVGVSVAGGNGGVSLTLGLKQNNGGCLSEPLPLTVTHFGLQGDGNSYIMGGFEARNRHFERDIGGQLLRDFVG